MFSSIFSPQSGGDLLWYIHPDVDAFGVSTEKNHYVVRASTHDLQTNTLDTGVHIKVPPDSKLHWIVGTENIATFEPGWQHIKTSAYPAEKGAVRPGARAGELHLIKTVVLTARQVDSMELPPQSFKNTAFATPSPFTMPQRTTSVAPSRPNNTVDDVDEQICAAMGTMDD